MSQEYEKLNKRLKSVIKKMKKIQKAIKGSEAPASIHELDNLSRLGEKYSATVQQIAQLGSTKKTKNS